MIFHYSQFCFKSVTSFKSTNLVDLKVQKYKNIISSLSSKKEEPIEDMGSELTEYLQNCSTNKTQNQSDVLDDNVIDDTVIDDTVIDDTIIDDTVIDESIFDLLIQKKKKNVNNKEPSFLIASSEPIQIDIDEI